MKSSQTRHVNYRESHASLRQARNPAPPVRINYWHALAKSLLPPLLILTFFAVAPHWLNTKIRASIVKQICANNNLPQTEKVQRTTFFGKADFEKICRGNYPQFDKLRQALGKDGIAGRFERMRWGLYLSITLAVSLGIAAISILLLNRGVRESRYDLIRSFRLSWKIAIGAALIETLLFPPLLAYGTFEFTTLLAGFFLPKLLILILFAGVVILCRNIRILFKNVPLEFKEPMSRVVAPEEAPELWQAVREAASSLKTAPPANIVVGAKLNFYVTELAVCHDRGRAEGRTLFVSYPGLKQLSKEDVVAVIGHELGHFVGDDTRMTREFYPLRIKAQATMVALARSKWMGWTTLQFLNFFSVCFGETIQAATRARELLADQKSAELTSPETAARALLKFQVLAEAFQRTIANRNLQEKNVFNTPLQTLVQESLISEALFWTQLFEKKTPHPLDSHPALNIRLEALGQKIDVCQAQAIAVEEIESALEQWFPNKTDLFADLTKQIDDATGKLRANAQAVVADYATPEGKELLDRYFPQRTWQWNPAFFWAMTILFGIFGAGCAALAILVVGSPLQRSGGSNAVLAAILFVIFGTLGIVLCWVSIANWIRHYHSKLTLNAEGLTYSGWKRPLRFKDVEHIGCRIINMNMFLFLRLKERRSPIWKFSIIRAPVKVISFTLNGLKEKPVTVAQTISRYFTRQVTP